MSLNTELGDKRRTSRADPHSTGHRSEAAPAWRYKLQAERQSLHRAAVTPLRRAAVALNEEEC